MNAENGLAQLIEDAVVAFPKRIEHLEDISRCLCSELKVDTARIR